MKQNSTTVNMGMAAFAAKAVAVAFVFAASSVAGGAKPLVLAERGKAAECSIAIPAKASPTQKYAAEELRDWMEKATGVKLPIVTVGAPGDGALPAKAIVLEMAGERETGNGERPDAFRLHVEGSRLYVTGDNDRGALYGAYEVLERFVGCRWYASWHTVVPRRDRVEVPADLDESQEPAFAMREPYWYDVTKNQEFAARLRVNSRSWKKFDEKYGGNPYRFGGDLGSCHTFDKLLSPRDYFDSHPEYFSMVNGRRIRDRTQLCLTNPDVLRIVTSNVLERIRRDPGAKFYGVSQNDWYNFCECPNCKAVDDEEGSHSGTMVRFVNAVAEAVEKEFPDAIIETLAYQYTRKAPKKTKLRRNVVPCLCTIECDFALPLNLSRFKENLSFCKDIEEWSELTDFLYIWDYTTDFSHYTMPWPNAYALRGNIQFFRRNKVKALFEQGAYQGRHADFGELKAWLLAKWMWNPDLPMEPLLDDFFAGYYGKGAPFVREYFYKIHSLQTIYSSRPDHPLLIFDGVSNPAIPDSFLEEMAPLWDKAVAATKYDPAMSYNVRMSKFSFDYMRLERSHKLLNLSKTRPLVPAEVRRSLAQSLLDRMAEAKDIDLAERDRTSLVQEWKRIAGGWVAPDAPGATTGELEDCHLPILNPGRWGGHVDDPKAGDGRALKLSNTHSQWCVQLPMGKFMFEPGKQYRLRARVRVDKARDGEAFWAGVYSSSAKCSRGGVRPRTKDVGDGYAWYTVATWVPAPDEFFWIGPGRFNADGKSPVNGVYIDKLEFSLVDSAEAAECDPAFSPGYFWMWNAKLDPATLIAQLDDMHAHGIRSVCIHPVPKAFRRGRFESHMEPDYLTPEYLGVFAKVVARARELGMDAWLYDEGGWPSGGACGLVAKADAKGAFCRRRLAFSGDGEPQLVVEPHGGNPPYPSIVEKGATEAFLALTHDAYAKAVPGDLGLTVRFAFTDEPSMPLACAEDRSSLAWTADFDQVFKAKKGYDLRPHVKELLRRKDDTDDRLARFRIDYHDVRADLFMERYMLPLRDWCRSHGMLSGGHLNIDDCFERSAEYGGHGDLMRTLRAMDCPGVDVIWRQLFPPSDERAATTLPFPRYAASAMHQNGGRFALSESFAIFGDGCSPDQMKWLVDYQLVRGINRFVLAYYAVSNARQWMLLFEPHSGPVTPCWDFEPHWFKYIERTAAFMAKGRPGAEIAVYFDARGLWAGGADREAAASCHYAVASALDRLNRDYDFVDDRSLALAEFVEGDSFNVGAMRYRALVLPTSKWMSDAARAKVEAFRKAGGVVVDGSNLARLPETLRIMGQGASQIRVMKRVDGERRIYLLVNESKDPLSVRIDLMAHGPIARYDAERGKLVAVPSTGGVVEWSFPGCGSAIFVTGTKPELPAPKRYGAALAELKDGWTVRRAVSHEAGKDDFVVRAVDEPPAPARLGDWRAQLGETFCGKAVYRVEFDSDAERDAQIDLGRVCWCAGVRLNGVDLGNRFFGPFQWEAKLAKGRNVLEVTVANLLSTLLGDRAVRARIAADYPPFDGYEARQAPGDLHNRESGLFGPVRVLVQSR
ncbi:MAG: DUF4838 domain-containing protein [Kiritimatiellae bacterium]|nr:DUF4838 domain-containing protein [Kiritimatiellia bacterium]